MNSRSDKAEGFTGSGHHLQTVAWICLFLFFPIINISYAQAKFVGPKNVSWCLAILKIYWNVLKGMDDGDVNV